MLVLADNKADMAAPACWRATPEHHDATDCRTCEFHAETAPSPSHRAVLDRLYPGFEQHAADERATPRRFVILERRSHVLPPSDDVRVMVRTFDLGLTKIFFRLFNPCRIVHYTSPVFVDGYARFGP